MQTKDQPDAQGQMRRSTDKSFVQNPQAAEAAYFLGARRGHGRECATSTMMPPVWDRDTDPRDAGDVAIIGFRRWSAKAAKERGMTAVGTRARRVARGAPSFRQKHTHTRNMDWRSMVTGWSVCLHGSADRAIRGPDGIVGDTPRACP